MIYLVEDSDGIRETVSAYLKLAGLEVREFKGVGGVLEAMEFIKPELAILDVMLPDGNGFSLAKKIHASFPEAPFLFLTARESESDRVTGLELGADDYVVKPFSPRELTLRVQAILRRSAGKAARVDGTGERKAWKNAEHCLEIDFSEHWVKLDGAPTELTLAEWNILSILARNGRSVTTRERLLGEALDYAHDGSERAVITHISNLRAKLGAAEWIETVRGVGYRFRGTE